MDTYNIQDLIDTVYAAHGKDVKDIARLLSFYDGPGSGRIWEFADKVKTEACGNSVIIRGIIEFSNICAGSCAYCGINRGNSALQRYSMTKEEIIEAAGGIYSRGIKTVVLQSGENRDLDPSWLRDVVSDLKSRYDMAITLSVGEKEYNEYKMWKNAGADRYLLKIETTNEKLYKTLHPGMDLSNRMNCLRALKDIGYQTGTGCIIGLKGQTIDMIAEDISFFGKNDFDMIGIGPFIAHSESPLTNEPSGSPELTLTAIALTRIITRNAHIPSTRALRRLAGERGHIALKAGANVIMFDFTPQRFSRLYDIYPDGSRDPVSDAGIKKIYDEVNAMGLCTDMSKGHSLKSGKRVYV